ncbi:sulfotransferase domain-containing protein [Waterburya agarophytonicola K14]|uniref:Sulfotransferase domain-containing protein n=1 Tax=Waterburya agarophytonicola KI4 TaxID=2874699 RepID=A0A964FHM4_9CYAN|nr:sulfotransferase domain-containing protein [Waterburya agarophytonicola]MCC0177749.1 sulfotransferase domain-containing protein [Waterburya agarophytonicola KI4]
MFLHKLTIDVAKEFKIPYYSINNNRYFNKIKQQSWNNFIDSCEEQACFGPIRTGSTKTIFPEALGEYSIILHLRDPRDVLTSLFFSHTYSHAKRKGGFNPDDNLRNKWEEEGIDKFALDNLPTYLERYQLLTSTLLDRPNVRLIKYEDMVSNYPEWLKSFLAGFSHLDIPQKSILGLINSPNSIDNIQQKLADKYNHEFTIPQSEDVYRHKRKIEPGDHKDKLKPETIELLNRQFAPILKLLSYE